ncbi:MAG: alkaline phosphatase D family protein [Acidobacteria bacterium]|nr:alkaline phosphatase D family protein [Acidobacteriota bacterium]
MKLRSEALFAAALLALACGAPTAEPAAETAAEPALERIGLGSCLEQADPQPIFDAILDDDFDLFVFLGDNVYGDVESEDMRELRDAYAIQAEAEGFSRLRASDVRLAATWDDHDYGLNDAGADFFGREEAQRIFEDFWDVAPDSERASRPGVYDAVTYGPPGQRVQLILLDTRYFRSPLRLTDERGAPGKERYMPDPDPSKTMLGEEQWAWLGEVLQEEADLRILASSIQVIADGHGYEAWKQMPAERDRLFGLLRETAANGVVIISGDRHRGGIYRRDDALDYPLLELTASSLNSAFASEEEAGRYRLGPTYRSENYGALSIDWTSRSVTLEVRGMDGEPALGETLNLDDLRAE